MEYGPDRYQDENKSDYVAGFVPIEKRFYPYRDAVSMLDEWFRILPNERGLRDKPTISGLSSAIKADKRAELAQEFRRIADARVETERKIGRVVPPSKRLGKGRDRNENQ